MAAANFSSDVLQMFYGQIPGVQNRNQREALTPKKLIPYDTFIISQTNFQEWLRVWWMLVNELNPNSRDLFDFANYFKRKYTDVVKNEIIVFTKAPFSPGLPPFQLPFWRGYGRTSHFFFSFGTRCLQQNTSNNSSGNNNGKRHRGHMPPPAKIPATTANSGNNKYRQQRHSFFRLAHAAAIFEGQ